MKKFTLIFIASILLCFSCEKGMAQAPYNVCDTTKMNSKFLLEIGIEAGDVNHIAIPLRVGTNRIYATISCGYNFIDNFFAVSSGPGTTFQLTDKFGFSLELAYAALFGVKSGVFDIVSFWRNSHIQLKSLFNYRFAKHFKIYAGPSFNILVQTNDNGGWFANPAIDVKIPLNLYTKTSKNSISNMWIGVICGIKFIK